MGTLASATSTYVLTANGVGVAPSWAEAAGGGLFTDGGDFSYLTSTTDDLVIGANSTSSAAIWFDVGGQMIRTGSGDLTIDTAGNLIVSDIMDVNNYLDLDISYASGYALDVNNTSASGYAARFQVNSSDVMTIGDPNVTISSPLSIEAAGDTGIAYDLQFTNLTASYIKSYAPLTIQSGTDNDAYDLTLKSAGTGSVVIADDLLPATTTTYNLGSATYKWNYLYAATTTIGDLVFGNEFRITEDYEYPEALIFFNAVSQEIARLDENGLFSPRELFVDGVVSIGTTSASRFTVQGLGTSSTSSVVNIQNSENSTLLYIQDDGKIGIGTSSPTNILTIAQNSATDPIADAWTVYSTPGSKIVLGTADDQTDAYLEKFKNLPVYKWKRSENEVERLGVLASSSTPSEILAFDAEGNIQGIDLGGYIGFLHETMKGQQTLIDELQETVSLLSVSEDPTTGQIVQLDITQLKSNLASIGLIVDEQGILTVDKLKAGEVEVSRGVTMQDRATGEYYCIYMENGQMKTDLGNCVSENSNSQFSNSNDPTQGGQANSNESNTEDANGTTTSSQQPVIYYYDNDGDGYGTQNNFKEGGSQPAGYVPNNQDCDDWSAEVNPAAEEICDDNIDNNCNGVIDENCPVGNPSDQIESTSTSSGQATSTPSTTATSTPATDATATTTPSSTAATSTNATESINF
ncbi:putative metal-binding motif-containing protein [Patescibacteria group bacterium]|nr:putative metal-binding motif-containing protein [Patescibacteria group bacterium]